MLRRAAKKELELAKNLVPYTQQQQYITIQDLSQSSITRNPTPGYPSRAALEDSQDSQDSIEPIKGKKKKRTS
ncbi:uncharacterized protein Bfra_001798 [Botrytis fragariae]|uniref:Uncharacterized protein n=1 Tax=Botrytis fragariae TaxID=1964551 RepID=A0A8H6B177_9HELO|nr:uncharacterized protein Bfra_001798 [Botrytis fragariae]KAF5877431.1 hypothetical protein Bfra_001798 [Botrytis fragariae]